eukprot:CAMPEP_0182948158 /NCGR_PEP_ID=MMETSP0105_2-20130417/59619_1 /TAXON_ID=81532 ORGANISM="Acanthoeca-like sp., Strain 10tr" /NCGR_SAMPLE_ID=MMETSP0105_2 /ASSEMBLY_ACC=CAM_ASM_000205 /LENGTH=662 /DNA_ID=CAMNT_0025088447 /DNA_START=23 /DNA_END=2011 /DNA_ORIENTATION=+
MGDWESEYDGGEQQQQGQGGGGFDPNGGMNVGANAFVPSFNAPAFVPGQAFAPPPAGGGYGGGFAPQMGGYGAPGVHGGGFQQQGYAPQVGGQPGYAQQPGQYWQPGQLPPGCPPAAMRQGPPPAQPAVKAKAPAPAPAPPKAATTTKPAAGPKAAAQPKPAGAAPAKAKPVAKATEPNDAKQESKKETKAPAKAAAAPAEFQGLAEADKALLAKDTREHLNIIFTGHVDAGKSTIGGHIMHLTGGVDKRTLEKYEREAKEKNRESWYLSWALDTDEEERNKGKTVECGKATFHTEKKHYTIIDAPGHKSFVPSMITGAVQADVAVLVISTRTGEFEAGFERGGQTREHAMLAKSVGVKKLVVVMNKMDLCGWKEARYLECQKKLMPFLKACGFKPGVDIHVMPLSGQKGLNLTKPLPEGVCPWYKGPCLVDFLDQMEPIKRHLDLPFRMPVANKFSEMGAFAMGKVQSGACRVGQKLKLMPNGLDVSCAEILINDDKAEICSSGDSLKMKLKGCEEDQLSPGYVLCHADVPCSVCYAFDAQVNILEYKSIIAAGFQCMLHIHTAIEEVAIKDLIIYMDKKTGKPTKARGKPKFMRQGDSVIVRLTCQSRVCVETFKTNPAMGRFSLRDEGKTIAVGKVMKLISLDQSTADAKAAAAAAIAD